MAPVTAGLVPAGSIVENRLTTCTSFYPTHAQSYEQREEGAERIGSLKPDGAAQRYAQLNLIPKSKKGVFEGERSADEIIGANGLLCMQGMSSVPFMPRN